MLAMILNMPRSRHSSDPVFIANPMMADWPRVLLTAMAGMDKGWGSGYSIMDELLAELQADGS
jgi:hypothetical protein